jgi:hypothetical protein
MRIKNHPGFGGGICTRRGAEIDPCKKHFCGTAPDLTRHGACIAQAGSVGVMMVGDRWEGSLVAAGCRNFPALSRGIIMHTLVAEPYSPFAFSRLKNDALQEYQYCSRLSTS